MIQLSCRLWLAQCDPLILESLACQEAVLLAHRIDISRPQIEGDSSVVINSLLGDPIPLAIQIIVHGINVLSRSIQSIVFIL